MKYIVTGGGGFVGKALCKELRALGAEVIAIARGNYPELAELGVQLLRADISKPSLEFFQAFEGAEAVFHVAAKVEMWGAPEEFYQVNVEGTKNVLEACKRASVKNLIFTSSPSVIAGGEDLKGVNEAVPYPKHFEALYPKTKSIAEKLVIDSHNPGVLHTVALRPHLIFGPGDTNLIPTVVERARAGKLMQIGDGSNLSDFTFIQDCIAAHLCALNALKTDPSAGGQAYFISQGDPMPLWDFVNRVVTASGLAPIKKRVSKGLALFVATIAEKVCTVFPKLGEPVLTRFLVSEMATSHYFDISAARAKLGFSPRFTVQEALKITFS